MNILILGAYCSCNLGDAVICDCVAHWLRQRYPNAAIEIKDVIDRSRSGPAKIPARPELEKRRIKAKIRVLATRMGVDLTLRRERRRIRENKAHLDVICAGDYDMVVFAGGQMFMDSYGAFLAYCTERFAQRNIPVFFNACGTGPTYSKAITSRLAAALRMPNVRHISCRDNVALARKRYAPYQPIFETADAALEAARVYGVEKDPRADTVGLGVLYPGSVSPGAAAKFWRAVISELDRRGQKWQMFSNGDPADIAFAQAVLQSIPRWKGHPERIRSCDREPEELLRTIASYESLISFRLHSHIIAASLDIPTVAVVWDEKLPFFFEKICHPERFLTVDTAASDVVAALEAARETGYDRNLLDSLSYYAREQLLSALEREGLT